MAIQSMTGFGRGEAGNDDWSITAEIKSVNHRFKDIRFKMPSMFSTIELDFRNTIGKHFKRGSFDISVSYKRAEKNSKFADIDAEKVTAFLTSMKSIIDASGVESTVRPTDFLRSEFYAERDDSKNEITLELAKEAFEIAITNLSESREEEGSKMVQVIEKHQETYQEHYLEISKCADTFQKNVEDKLKKRFSEFQSDLGVDEPRFLQEVVYYLEKLDVHEEINRIQAHLEKLCKLINSKGEIGRQMDFLIQELNRETNTIGSKSSLNDISDAVVQMKVQLEKIREQGLNIE